MMNPVNAAECAWLPGEFTELVAIGSGGQADVWRARHVVLGPVCVKRFRLGQASAFYRELSVFTSFESPYVVAIFEVLVSDPKRPIIVMEYCAGGSVRRHLSSLGMMSLSQTLLLGVHAARGLRALHDSGLVHADLKPENIFRRRQSGPAEWKLADFGISRPAMLWRGGPREITPAYAAPEQRTGRALPASDIYSLAKLLIECLTGNPDVSADSGALAPYLRGFLGNCLEANPADRPEIESVVEFLEAALTHERAVRHVSRRYGATTAPHWLTFQRRSVGL